MANQNRIHRSLFTCVFREVPFLTPERGRELLLAPERADVFALRTAGELFAPLLVPFAGDVLLPFFADDVVFFVVELAKIQPPLIYA